MFRVLVIHVPYGRSVKAENLSAGHRSVRPFGADVFMHLPFIRVMMRPGALKAFPDMDAALHGYGPEQGGLAGAVFSGDNISGCFMERNKYFLENYQWLP